MSTARSAADTWVVGVSLLIVALGESMATCFDGGLEGWRSDEVLRGAGRLVVRGEGDRESRLPAGEAASRRPNPRDRGNGLARR
jgi:hypothetical protein